jgi:DNA-binding SARP family transcriptional activator
MAVQRRWNRLVEGDHEERATRSPAPAAEAERRPATSMAGAGKTAGVSTTTRTVESDLVPAGPMALPMLQLENTEWSRLLLVASVFASGPDAPPADPLLLTIGSDEVSVTFEGPMTLAAPFDQADRVQTILGPRWSLPRRIAPFMAVPAAARHASAGTVARLVSIPARDPARDPAGDTTALVSLAALRTLVITGDLLGTDDLLRSMVVDSATRRWSDGGDVILVGFGTELHGLDGVRVVAAVTDAVEIATALLSPSAPSECPPPPGECLPPPDGGASATAATFFVSSADDGASLAELVALANDDAVAVSVVTTQPVAGARWTVSADSGDRARVESRLQRASDCSPAGAARTDDRSAGVLAPSATSEVHTASDPPLTRLQVNVLGAVKVLGGASSFDRRPKLTELVVYLAMHPEGATTDAWATALWPDRRMPVSTLSNRLSEARLALGIASDGYAHVRKIGNRYSLGPDLVTDWEQFRSLADSANPAAWRQALELVRGRPFEGLRETQWTLIEGVIPAMESTVVELACRLAEVLLANGGAEGAEWAARRAMLVCPWDERLYRVLMRGADALGNRAGVDAALRHLGRVLENKGDPLNSVHPDTASLYRQLTARRR